MKNNPLFYFEIFANYSLAEYPEKHIDFLKEASGSEGAFAEQGGLKDTAYDKVILGEFERDAEDNKKRHAFFKDILQQITTGKPFSDIKDFVALFLNVEILTHKYHFSIEKKSDGKEYIQSKMIFDVHFDHSPSTLTYSLACHSLLMFLASNKREKIKSCPYCGRIFVAKDTKKKFCYGSKCFREYKRLQKQHQRENEPDIYANP